MSNFNSLIYQYDRKFLTFINHICLHLNKSNRKFYIDICYGIVKSNSLVLSKIAFCLDEDVLLKKSVERLSKHLKEEIDDITMLSFHKYSLSLMNNDLKVFCVDDSDITKPYGKEFEALGKVKDASSINGEIKNGYKVSSIIGLSKTYKHPLPFYGEIYSSKVKGYKSDNTYTIKGLDIVTSYLKEYEAIFVFDRGYDDNKFIDYFKNKHQYFVIRLKNQRKVIDNKKKIKINEYAKSIKGRYRISITYKSKKQTAKIGYKKIKLNGLKEEYTIIVSYLNNNEEPMILLTNKEVNDRDSALSILYNYSSRWKIEEFFRFKKEELDFEDFRVRSLNSINHIAFCLDLDTTFLTSIIEKHDDFYLKVMSYSKALKANSYIKYYQLLSGINAILGHKEKGIRNKEEIRHRKTNKQLQLF